MRSLAYSIAASVVLTACASTGRGPQIETEAEAGTAPEPTQIVRVDTVVVEAKGRAELEGRLARLQLRLLEHEAVIDDLRRSLDAQRQEVVRNMAKLQSQASRAEAASGMAEAELALQGLAGVTDSGAGSDEYGRATDLLVQASTEFDRGNFGGALYLANEARVAAVSGSDRLLGFGTAAPQAGEVPFAVPVPLTTLQRSNIRGGPGLDHAIALTLDPGAELTGLSYTSEWVRVSWERGSEGWIFHTLVASGDQGRP